MNVYVALTVDASSSCASIAYAPRGNQESHADRSSTRRSHSRATSSQRSHGRKPEHIGVACRRSKRMKVNAGCALAAPSSHDGALSATDFDRSEWEIMYPHFSKKALLVLLTVFCRRRLCLVCAVLCAFVCVFVFCFALTYFHCARLCLLPSSGVSTRLRVLVFPFDVR
jgi:hypothetical protein